MRRWRSRLSHAGTIGIIQAARRRHATANTREMRRYRPRGYQRRYKRPRSRVATSWARHTTTARERTTRVRAAPARRGAAAKIARQTSACMMSLLMIWRYALRDLILMLTRRLPLRRFRLFSIIICLFDAALLFSMPFMPLFSCRCRRFRCRHFSCWYRHYHFRWCCWYFRCCFLFWRWFRCWYYFDAAAIIDYIHFFRFRLHYWSDYAIIDADIFATPCHFFFDYAFHFFAVFAAFLSCRRHFHFLFIDIDFRWYDTLPSYDVYVSPRLLSSPPDMPDYFLLMLFIALIDDAFHADAFCCLLSHYFFTPRRRHWWLFRWLLFSAIFHRHWCFLPLIFDAAWCFRVFDYWCYFRHFRCHTLAAFDTPFRHFRCRYRLSLIRWLFTLLSLIFSPYDADIYAAAARIFDAAMLLSPLLPLIFFAFVIDAFRQRHFHAIFMSAITLIFSPLFISRLILMSFSWCHCRFRFRYFHYLFSTLMLYFRLCYDYFWCCVAAVSHAATRWLFRLFRCFRLIIISILIFADYFALLMPDAWLDFSAFRFERYASLSSLIRQAPPLLYLFLRRFADDFETLFATLSSSLWYSRCRHFSLPLFDDYFLLRAFDAAEFSPCRQRYAFSLRRLITSFFIFFLYSLPLIFFAWCWCFRCLSTARRFSSFAAAADFVSFDYAITLFASIISFSSLLLFFMMMLITLFRHFTPSSFSSIPFLSMPSLIIFFADASFRFSLFHFHDIVFFTMFSPDTLSMLMLFSLRFSFHFSFLSIFRLMPDADDYWCCFAVFAIISFSSLIFRHCAFFWCHDVCCFHYAAYASLILFHYWLFSMPMIFTLMSFFIFAISNIFAFVLFSSFRCWYLRLLSFFRCFLLLFAWLLFFHFFFFMLSTRRSSVIDYVTIW